jgi:hypothetical protein
MCVYVRIICVRLRVYVCVCVYVYVCAYMCEVEKDWAVAWGRLLISIKSDTLPAI